LFAERLDPAIGFAVVAIVFALNSHERHRKLGRLQARIDALTVRLDTARKSTRSEEMSEALLCRK
jgi:hypothetical protein